MAFQRSALVVVFWRAVRLSLPIALSACGPSRAPPVSAAQRDCSMFANCGRANFTVEVTTTLPEGTVLERFECDQACASGLCPSQAKTCTVNAGSTTVTCSPLSPAPFCPIPGRPVPEWHHAPEACNSAPAFFAQMALAEAESVAEFERLTTELELHGAPAALISRARAAAEEERRHAVVTAGLAHALPPVVPAPPAKLRSLAQLAEANLLEGCINETMSAVLVASQAANAPCSETRTLLASIADEELSHAEFSWELHAWLISRLDAAERRALAAAGSLRVAAAVMHPVQQLPEAARLECGLPNEEVARGQAQALVEGLWGPALTALA